MLTEGELGPQQRCAGGDERRAIALQQPGRGKLAAPLRQLGLMVEELELAGPAGHEQVNDALGPGTEVRRFGYERAGRSRRSGGGIPAQQLVERHGAQAHAAFLEEPAAGDVGPEFV